MHLKRKKEQAGGTQRNQYLPRLTITYQWTEGSVYTRCTPHVGPQTESRLKLTQGASKDAKGAVD